MIDILVALLTSKDSKKLERCIESVLPQTTSVVVVCNTLDFSYVDEAKKVADRHNVEFIVTESNGTPAKGKNSVLEIFRSRNNDYYMQIDADDYLTSDALTKIEKIVEESSGLDVLGLTNGSVKYWDKETKSDGFLLGTDIYDFANVTGANKIRLMELGKFLVDNLQYNRMLLYSKKTVNSFNFDEDFIASEDIVATYKLYYDPNIKYIITNEDLYIYDLEENGNFHYFLSNLTEIKKVLRKLRSIVNETELQN